MNKFAVALVAVSFSTAALAHDDDMSNGWQPLASELKAGPSSMPKAYLMGGTGFIKTETTLSGSKINAQGMLAEVGVGLKLGMYAAIEARYFTAPSMSADGNLDAKLSGFGAGLTGYVPLNYCTKLFARYDLSRVTERFSDQAGSKVSVRDRINGFSLGVEGRLVGKNYLRASYQILRGTKIDGDVAELAYIRRL